MIKGPYVRHGESNNTQYFLTTIDIIIHTGGTQDSGTESVGLTCSGQVPVSGGRVESGHFLRVLRAVRCVGHVRGAAAVGVFVWRSGLEHNTTGLRGTRT